MASVTIRDDALWVRHIVDADLRNHIEGMAAGAPLRLLVAGQSILFRKMANGRDGRPTSGLKADADDGTSRPTWARLQERRGDTVPVSIDETKVSDPYLAYLNELFWEWNTPEDAEAFDDL